MDWLFTSESVSIGHPDKIADTISDAILDEYLKQDKNSKVAVETLVTTNKVIVAWEVKSSAKVDIETTIRNTIKEIWYTRPWEWFDYQSCDIEIYIHEQSPDISMGVEKEDEEEQGAWDQWMMFWYATNETENKIPLTLDLSNKLLLKLRESNKDFIRPDAKSQVTVEYKDDKPIRIDTIVLSTMHTEDIDEFDLNEFITNEIIGKVIEENNLSYLMKGTRILINPTWRFVIGWPNGDTWLTWRKIIVDTYWGWGAHWGWAFSWKDPSKVDRSGAYYARYIAKNLVKAWVCDKCLIQVSYAIGVAEPVSIYVNTYWTAKINKTDPEISKLLKENFSFKPKHIEKVLNLRNPIYKQTSAYWHYGRKWKEDYFPREMENLLDEIKNVFNF